MVHKFNIAVMGRGLVCIKLLEYLQKDDSINSIEVFGSENTTISVEDKTYEVKKYEQMGQKHYDVVFGVTDVDTTKKWFNIVDTDLFIDNSELFRRYPEVPLVVGKTNTDLISKRKVKIIANPNCIVAMVARVLYPLNKRYSINKAIITTYQSISGLGQKALSSYENERDDDVYLDGKISNRFIYKKENFRLYDNIVPYIGAEDENNTTHEEKKIEFELQKILNGVEIAAMCARVPVKYGHSAFVHLTFKDMIDYNRVKAFIENIESVKVLNVVTSSVTKNTNEVFVGRIKKDNNCPYALMFFITSDNLTIGSALNSYELFLAYKEQMKKWFFINIML